MSTAITPTNTAQALKSKIDHSVMGAVERPRRKSNSGKDA